MMSLIENGNIHKMLIFNKEGEKLIEKQLCHSVGLVSLSKYSSTASV